MLYDDDFIRTIHRDFRLANGRDPTHIFMPLSLYEDYVSWMNKNGMGIFVTDFHIRGIRVVIWDRDEVMCQPYTKPEVMWRSE